MSEYDYSKRPKPHAFVQYDPNNYYAILGVSPLTSTQEIKNQINRMRKVALEKRRGIVDQKFSDVDEEVIKLQEIEQAIGSPQKRETYDRLNPQNELLTVQPGIYDRWFDPRYRIDLVSAWLLEELGQEQFLPSPESVHLWAPQGIDPELLAFLTQFEEERSSEQRTNDPQKEDIQGEALQPNEESLSLSDIELLRHRHHTEDTKVEPEPNIETD